MKPTKPESTTQKVIKNTFFQGIAATIAKIGNFIFTIIVARLLFPELFGIYSLVLSITLTLVTLTDLGLGGAAIRYISESLGKNKSKKEARSRFLFIFKFRFIISLIVSLLLFIFAGLIATLFKKPDLVLPLQIGSIYLFISALYGLANPIFLAVQKIKYLTLIEAIFQASRIILIFIFLHLYKTVETAFIVLIISLFFASIASLIIINKKYKFLIKGPLEPVERKRIIIFSSFLALASLNVIIFGNVDKFILAYFLPAEFIGYYAAIFTIVAGVLGLTSFAQILFPVFTQLKGEKLKTAFKKTFHYLALIVFPAAIGLAYVFIPALLIFYGQAYVPLEYRLTLSIVSVILSLLIIEGVFATIYTTLFNALEKPKFPAISGAVSAFINIFLDIILVFYLVKIKPEYGLIGAAVATTISLYSFLFYMSILSSKKFKIVPDKNSIIKPLMASLLMLAFLFIYDYFINLNIFTGIVMVFLAALIYFIVLFLIKGITKEDFKLISLLKN